MHHVAVGGTRVEVEELGTGAPVAVLQTALAIDELVPLSRELARTLWVWHVHRPGYGLSGPARVASVEADADLVAAVLDRLGAGAVHLVGASYSAALALTLAARHPAAVRSLSLVEPPPYGTPGATEFRSANEGLLELHARLGAVAALDHFMGVVDGPGWRAGAERYLPGSVGAMERDAETFFRSDVPALLRWQFEDGVAATIGCPTLLVGGGESLAWFDQMLERLQRVLGDTTRVTVAGAGHSVALTRPVEVAAAVHGHVRRVSSGTRAAGDPGPNS